MTGSSIRLAALAVVTGVSLAGGLVFGGALVSAEDDTPTPAAAEDSAPHSTDNTPAANGGSTDDGDCPRDDGGNFNGTGARFGGRPGTA